MFDLMDHLPNPTEMPIPYPESGFLRNRSNSMANDVTRDNLKSEHTAALSHTIENRLVSAVFQPIVDLQSGQVAGYEALTRPGPESQFDNAEQMFTAAEGNPLGWDLECLARECALEAASGWPQGVLLFLNSSPEIVSDERFSKQVTSEIRSTRGLSPSRIVLEITERSKETEFDGLTRTLDTLRNSGFHIAIDDVGAGTSGLNRITSLKPGWLKLDRELIDHIDHDKVRQHLIRFLVYFGKLSSIRIIAEGIERVEELDTVIDLGVRFGQGYLLARPGERGQDISDEMRVHIREKVRAAFPALSGDSTSTHAGSLARAVKVVESTKTVSVVAAGMLQDLHQPGVIVADGGRYAGWVDRDVVLRAASDGRAGLAISFLLGAHMNAVDATMSAVEMLDLASTRDGHTMASPMVVLDAGQIVGVVSMPDLLKAGASLCRATQFRHAPLTGLPGRVRTDLYLRELLGSDAHAESIDVAFIDIKGFAEYNQHYGYELGDQLIQDFVGLIRAMLTTLTNAGECFLGHLGDDQFIVTAPKGLLSGQIEQLTREFESLNPDAQDDTTGPGARIMLLEGVNGYCPTTKELFRSRALLRLKLDRSPRIPGSGRSDLIIFKASELLDQNHDDLRRSA
jgi:EAL domain-containing protein (putative c-di-GMP-specific phosphodiesterase class I)/GGDEF domain-containing protein